MKISEPSDESSSDESSSSSSSSPDDCGDSCDECSANTGVQPQIYVEFGYPVNTNTQPQHKSQIDSYFEGFHLSPITPPQSNEFFDDESTGDKSKKRKGDYKGDTSNKEVKCF
jgi:hypothetical protein